jgi:hypothetical protein
MLTCLNIGVYKLNSTKIAFNAKKVYWYNGLISYTTEILYKNHPDIRDFRKQASERQNLVTVTLHFLVLPDHLPVGQYIVQTNRKMPI